MDGVHREVKRALEIDLEEIRLLAEAAAIAPNIVIRYKLLRHIEDELREVFFWNHHLGHVEYAGRPPYYPPYDPYQAEGGDKAKSEE